MKQFFLFVVFVLCAVMLGACSNSAKSEVTAPVTTVAAPLDREIIEIVVGGHTLSVEAVTSPDSITLGLGQRDEIGSDGMLFFLPEKRVANFWMHGMRFPLDMVWIEGNIIVGIEKNVPAPVDPSSTALPTYSSGQPVTHVLELSAGKADELGLEAGMEVKI